MASGLASGSGADTHSLFLNISLRAGKGVLMSHACAEGVLTARIFEFEGSISLQSHTLHGNTSYFALWAGK